MSFVQLREIPHTSGFRIAALFLLLFTVSSLSLFGFIYWKTSRHMEKDVDLMLYVRLTNRIQLPSTELATVIKQHAERDPSYLTPQGLFSASGNFIAGQFKFLPRHVDFETPQNFTTRRILDNKKIRLRGILHRLPSGEILVISANIHRHHEFNELLLGAIISGCVLIFILGTIGAIIIGKSSQKQLNDIISAIHKINQGNLSERLPVSHRYNDINKLAILINQMLDDIERLMQQLKGACDDIAHDLRTPLTRLIAGLERMQRKQRTPEEYAQAVDQAVAEAHSLLMTFKSLLKISEIENNIQKANFTKLSLNTIIQDVTEFFQPLAENKHINLQTLISHENIEILGDSHLLFDALSNLLDNALKFTPANGQVTVSLINTAQKLEITVADTGIGIADDEKTAVLRRFYRSERSRHTPGNGLGLSMVAAIAQLHAMQLSITDTHPGCAIHLTMLHN